MILIFAVHIWQVVVGDINLTVVGINNAWLSICRQVARQWYFNRRKSTFILACFMAAVKQEVNTSVTDHADIIEKNTK